MERAAVERIAETSVLYWIEQMPLEEWVIVVKTETLEDADGTVSIMAEYRHATIRIDVDRHHDRAKVQSTVKHEMQHILTAEFALFWEVVEPEFPIEMRPMAERIFQASWELVVRRLERCWEDEE